MAIIVAAIALTVATAGTGSVVLAMAYSAAIGAGSSFSSTMVATGGDWKAALKDAAIGGALGALSAGATAGVMKFASLKLASTLAQQEGGRVVSIEAKSLLSRGFNSKLGNLFGWAGDAGRSGFGSFAKGGTLFKEWGSIEAFTDVTGPLGSRALPDTVGLFRNIRSFYAVERLSSEGGGSLSYECLVPHWTGSSYLSKIADIPLPSL